MASKACLRLLGEQWSSLQKRYCSGSEGIKYYNFTYYPRFPDKEDPPWDRSKLFKVQRVKPYKGNPHWEKAILEKLGLIGKRSDVAIVKNVPEMNALLWKIKHLVKITPIIYANGPLSDEDVGAAYLKENGEVINFKIPEEELKASEKFAQDKRKMDGKTLKKQLRYKWLNPW